MNKKNGFTLVELLVVIAIIAILSLLVVPSVITVNKNINERLYNQKSDYVERAAELFATNKEDIFNGAEEVKVYVYELLAGNYLEPDKTSECPDKDISGNSIGSPTGISFSDANKYGCMINPIDKTSMNNDMVILRKKSIGVVAEIVPVGKTDTSTTVSDDSDTLVNTVCDLIGRTGADRLYAKWGTGDTDYCWCKVVDGKAVLYKAKVEKTGSVYTITGDGINEDDHPTACVIAGSNPNNYLKYGSNKANWRVVGLYNLDGSISAKMITLDPVDD